MWGRPWHCLLLLSGTITLTYGAFTPWSSAGEHLTFSGLFSFSMLFTFLGALSLLGWALYSAWTYRNRREPPNTAAIKGALATAIAAAITLASAIALLIVTLRALAPPPTLLEASPDQPTRSLTSSPWLALEGATSILIGAAALWRTERARDRAWR